jgi:hypothetical protein
MRNEESDDVLASIAQRSHPHDDISSLLVHN